MLLDTVFDCLEAEIELERTYFFLAIYRQRVSCFISQPGLLLYYPCTFLPTCEMLARSSMFLMRPSDLPIV